MNQLHFGIKQLKIGKTMGVLYLFASNHVNMLTGGGFCRVKSITYVTDLCLASIHKSLAFVGVS